MIDHPVSNRALADHDDESIDFEFLIAAAQRQWRVVAATVMVSVILGVAYIISATPLFTSTTRILYDQSQSNAVNELTSVSGVFEDQSEFESQMELIKSERIAAKVVDRHNLHLNESFLAEGQSGLGAVISSIRNALDITRWFSEPELSAEEIDIRKRSAIAILTENVSATRVNRTYIIELNYRSQSPELAQAIARSFAQSYLTDQLDSKYDATRRASEWLQTRIEELKQQSLQADLAVQAFKAENDLFSTDRGQNIAEAQLTGANTQLIAAKGAIAQRKAEFDLINAAINSGQVTAAVEAALDSDIITGLRAKYLAISKEHAEFSAKLGDQHIKVINLRAELVQYQRLMFDELLRIRDVFENRYQVALEQRRSLQKNLAAMVGQTASANKTQVRLRELEREAATYKSLLENFLVKYQEALQQQSFPVNDARIIEEAKLPDAPSHPRKALTLALSFVLGAIAGGGIGAFREYRERFFRTGDQVRDTLDIEFLGLIPMIESDMNRFTRQGTEQTDYSKSVVHTNGVSDYVDRQPLSAFAEALRGAKVAADITLEGRHSKVIGVVSCLPGEGKSTVSSNFAHLLAMQGFPTLLIDGDIRNPGQTRTLARHAEVGLVEVLMDNVPFEQALLSDPKVPLRMLPAVIKNRISHTSDLLASQSMHKLLVKARESFSYIVVDLPPLAPVVDVKAFANRVDGFVFVTEWGKTTRSLVKTILDSNPQINVKVLGIILNKADMGQMKYYRSHGSSEYYYSQYSSYYRDDANPQCNEEKHAGSMGWPH